MACRSAVDCLPARPSLTVFGHLTKHGQFLERLCGKQRALTRRGAVLSGSNGRTSECSGGIEAYA
jgi:hypothetical protein